MRPVDDTEEMSWNGNNFEMYTCHQSEVVQGVAQSCTRSTGQFSNRSVGLKLS